MKVCHLTYDMRIGGTEQVIVNIVEGLHPASKKNAVEPQQDEYFHEILCIEKTIGPFGEKLIRKGIKIQCLSRKNGFDYRLVLKIRNYIKSESIDILHCHQYTPWSYGALACIGTDVHLLIVGDGETRPSLEKLIHKLGLEKQVTLAGYITSPKLYMNAMDIYWLTSFSEGTSMTLLEALSIGKPCVVTNAGGNSEIIKHRKNGYVVDIGDKDALAKYSLEAYAKTKEIKENNKMDFNMKFDSTIMNKQYQTCYAEITQGRKQ